MVTVIFIDKRDGKKKKIELSSKEEAKSFAIFGKYKNRFKVEEIIINSKSTKEVKR